MSEESFESRRYSRTSSELWYSIRLIAREMRQQPTPAEDHLWKYLRSNQIAGLKFRRQHSIDRFIVDFYCSKARLIVEVDGDIHQYTQEEDALRQAFLESMGRRLLRFSNESVLTHTSQVIAEIEAALSNKL